MSEIELLKRRLARERTARKQAEQILESKALELYKANESLRKLNESLESQIAMRTQDLQESEARYRNVIDEATDIIYSTNEEGYFTFINPKGSEAFGYGPNEILGKRYIDFVLDEYKADLFKYYTKFRDDGLTQDYFEFPIRSKSGKVHWIGQNVNRIEAKDGAFYYNAVARDITLRKTAEEELDKAQKSLVQSEVKYRSVLENLELGLMEVDTKGIIRRVYDRFCKMTGYSKEELIGKEAIATLVVEGYEHILKEQDQNRLNNQAGVYEIQVRRKDGKQIWVLISGAPFYNSNGDVIGSLGIHFDITDRKELESNLKIARQKAVDAQKAEQQFLANMSHEIRTPLNAIIGMSHLLNDTDLDEKQKEFVEILSDSATLLKGLVSDILDISKIDSGMAEANITHFDLRDFFSRLIKTFEIRAHDKGIKLVDDIQLADSCVVHADNQWLNQIFINLISNGIKFTSQGEVKLSVKKLKSAETSSLFYFEVSDTGIGMKESEIETIFTSFKQANTSVRTEFGGTGLGLSIASRLVSLLGGELEVESEEGKGSRFFFSLNIDTASSDVIPENVFKEYKITEDNDIKLLIVEDNLMNQKYISALLRKWKLSFDIAENGQQAVDKYKQQHYDLIFMDLSMPIIDGYEATNIIRSLPGDQIPIIALTASTFLSKKELALKAGMTDFLAKPFTPQELSQMLHKYLAKQPALSNQAQPKLSTNLLDRESLNAFYAGDNAAALDMFLTYTDVIDQEFQFLEQATAFKSSEEMRKQVHKMKPMFNMVGLTSVANECERLLTELPTMSIEELISRSQQVVEEARSKHGSVLAEIQRLNNMLNQNE